MQVTQGLGAGDAKIKLDFAELVGQASWPVRLTLALLVVSSIAVWMIAALKFLQLQRLKANAFRFEQAARRAGTPDGLYQLAASTSDAPGARVVSELRARATHDAARLEAAAERAIVDERTRARTLLSPLGTIAAASPFIGLFGTVYGIMDAFVRIGAAKSASLPVVAPAIGEALVTTAIGLATAIPAVAFYNEIDRRVGELVAELEASAAEWVALLKEREAPMPLVAPSFPPGRG